MQSGNTLIFMEGGHSTLIKGMSVTEVEDAISDARAERITFVYLQPENFEDNTLCVDPHKVVAITATRT